MTALGKKALFPFGYGLSYTTFEYSDATISSDTMKRGESLTVKVKVKNTGDYDADETVLLYIKDRFGSVIRPVKELKAYEKIHLLKGEEKTVEFTITEETLSFLRRDMTFGAEAGEFVAVIGNSGQQSMAMNFWLED